MDFETKAMETKIHNQMKKLDVEEENVVVNLAKLRLALKKAKTTLARFKGAQTVLGLLSE